MEEIRFPPSQMQKKDARWCRKCEEEASEKKQCNAPEGCFKFKTAYAFRTTEWNSIGERLCGHCFHGKKRRKWGHHFCFECGDQKHKKDFQNVVGKLTPTSSRKYLRCDQCVAKHKQREKAQEKQRMTEMAIPERQAVQRTAPRAAKNDYSWLSSRLCKHGCPKMTTSIQNDAAAMKKRRNLRTSLKR